MNTQRHSWSDPERFPYKTERACNHCGLVKVTRHEPEIWTEFWRDGEQVRTEGGHTPACEPTEQVTPGAAALIKHETANHQRRMRCD